MPYVDRPPRRRPPSGRGRSGRSCRFEVRAADRVRDAPTDTILVLGGPLRKYPDGVDPLALLQPRDTRLVRAGVRRADAGAGARLAGDRARRAHADPGADRLGQDARRLPLRDRPAQRASPAKGLRLLYVSPLKALNYDVERNLRGPLAGLAVRAPRRRAHRRHAAEGARARCCASRPTS